MDELKNMMEILDKIKAGEKGAHVYTDSAIYVLTKELVELKKKVGVLEFHIQMINTGYAAPMDNTMTILRNEMRAGFQAVADVLHAMEGMQEELGHSIKELIKRVRALEKEKESEGWVRP